MSRSIVLLSGGIDSAVTLASAHRRGDEIFALSFLYHLRPFRERLAAYRLLQDFPGKLTEVPVPFLYPSNKNSAVPEGYFSNRNMIFYAIAAHFSERNACETIIAGHTAEDHQDYPDASSSFLERLQRLINEALLSTNIQIELPLGSMTKLQVVQKAIEWNVPLHHTWSCYFDGLIPCGKCVSCVERASAFESLNIADPLLNRA